MIIVSFDEAKTGTLHIGALKDGKGTILRVPYGELNWWEFGSCLQAMKDINESSSIYRFSPRYPHRGEPAAVGMRILECKLRWSSNIALTQ
jgi:hypothetical protein